MISPRFRATLLASLSFLALHSASYCQTSVATDPVGFVNISCKAASDTNIAISLDRPPEYIGTTGTISGNVITVLNSPGWSNNVWTYGGGSDPTKTYYALMTSGSMEGEYFTVTSSGSNSVTVSPNSSSTAQAQGIAAGDTLKIIPYWTLNTLFPSGSGITASPDPFNPKSTVLLTSTNAGINLPLSTSFFYYDGTNNLGPAGWYVEGNLGAGTQSNMVLYPDQYYIVRNPAGSATTATIMGAVHMCKFRTVLNRLQANTRQDNFIGISFPVDLTLMQTGLQSSSAFTNSSDPFNPKDTLLVYNNTSTGINKPLGTSYFYYDGTNNLGPAGWYIEGNLGAGTQDSVAAVIKAAQGFVIRKATGAVTSATWAVSKPY